MGSMCAGAVAAVACKEGVTMAELQDIQDFMVFNTVLVGLRACLTYMSVCP